METTAISFDVKIPSFRSRVMTMAHRIRKDTGKCWAVCLWKAWRAYKLIKKMKEGVVAFVFEKVDGSIRYAYGTLQLPDGATANGGSNPGAVSFYDTIAKGFRSFKPQNILAIANS